MIKQNPYILSILEPKACWHEFEEDINDSYHPKISECCINCGGLTGTFSTITDNPDYYTATGIQDIKKWFLESMWIGEFGHICWYGFMYYIVKENWADGETEYGQDDIPVIGDVFTDPRGFADCFVSYAKENKLGDLSLIEEEKDNDPS